MRKELQKYTKQAHVSSKVECSTITCPRLTAFTNGEIAHFAVPREDALRDETGHYWCQECKKRGELMNWAHAHTWPSIHCPQYAVGADAELWRAALMLGKPEMIDALEQAVAAVEEL